MVRRLGERVEQEGLKIIGVATSETTAELARELKIPLRELDDVDALDINLDGADEIDPQFRMIKGRGAPAAREDRGLRRQSSGHDDHGRQAGRPARHDMPIPVEVSPIGAETHRAAAPTARSLDDDPPSADGSVYLTDGGNAIHRLPVRVDRRPRCARPPAPVDGGRPRNRAVHRSLRYLDRRHRDGVEQIEIGATARELESIANRSALKATLPA